MNSPVWWDILTFVSFSSTINPNSVNILISVRVYVAPPRGIWGVLISLLEKASFS